MFYKTVDMLNREEMLTFLDEHFRYHTMNSWNGQKSFANNVKLHNLGLGDHADKAWDIVCNGLFEPILTEAIQSFKDDDLYLEGNTEFSLGCNGRSGGYIVLYGETDWAKRVLYDQDYLDYNDDDDNTLLKCAVKAVCALDQFCDNMVAELIEVCKTHSVEDQTIYIPKEIKILVPSLTP
jgi:hypothetical protein